MKRFTIPCDFGGQKSPFDVYIGLPKAGNHPLQHQANWLSTERGGSIPTDIWESFANLLKLSEENNVSFEELCVYALDAANKKKEQQKAQSMNGHEKQKQVQKEVSVEKSQEKVVELEPSLKKKTSSSS